MKDVITVESEGFAASVGVLAGGKLSGIDTDTVRWRTKTECREKEGAPDATFFL